MADILKFAEIRYTISGNILPVKPLGLTDSMVNLADPYTQRFYTGDPPNFIFQNSPFPNQTTTVITELSGNQLLDQRPLAKLLSVDNIKLSIGIAS